MRSYLFDISTTNFNYFNANRWISDAACLIAKKCDIQSHELYLELITLSVNLETSFKNFLAVSRLGRLLRVWAFHLNLH